MKSKEINKLTEDELTNRLGKLKNLIDGIIIENYDEIIAAVGRGEGLLDLADKIVDEIELA